MATKEEHKRALKAFKKRLKALKQDDESTLGGGPLSGGKRSGIVAVRPPEGFPPEVWTELVEKGRLKKTPGEYTFELVPPKQPPKV